MTQLLTVKEVAFHLKVSIKTIYQWVELRQMPFLKVNGCVRFEADAVDAWLRTCKCDPSYGKIYPAQAVAVPRKGR